MPVKNSASKNTVAPSQEKHADQAVADQVPQHAAGVQGQLSHAAGNVEVANPQPAPMVSTNPPLRARISVEVDISGNRARPAVGKPAEVADPDREQVGQIAEQVEQDVGKPRADHPARLMQNMLDVAAVRPPRVRGCIARQRDGQIELLLRSSRSARPHASRDPAGPSQNFRERRRLLAGTSRYLECLRHYLKISSGEDRLKVIIINELYR